jgi:DNA-binding SARP family transcriptional activator
VLAIDGTQEGAWRALMRAEAARGDHGAALAAYETCRETMAARFGARPAAETESLARSLREDGGTGAVLAAGGAGAA